MSLLDDPDWVSLSSDDAARLASAPAEALEVLTNAGGRADKREPCCWLDESTRTCRWYEHRPNVCRGFVIGGEECREMRAMVVDLSVAQEAEKVEARG